MSLLEMMLKSGNGEGFSQIQQQFGLNANQAEKALEAVMPAFSTGLKRNASSPMDFGAFMQALSGGQHARYVDDPSTAFSTEGVLEGNGVLKHLFGSKQTSRAIAAEASKASGVGADIIKKMLPVIASMVMGGLFKQSTGQTQNMGNYQPANVGGGLGGGILGDILGELVKGGLKQQTTTQRRQTGGRSKKDKPQDNILGDLLEQMMGGGSRQPTDRSTGRSRDYQQDNPLGEIFENMLGQKRGRYQPEPETQSTRGRTQRKTRDQEDDYNRDHFNPDNGFEDIGSSERFEEPAPRTTRRAPQKRGGGLEDLFGDMFETGGKTDDGYQNNIESILDKLMKG